MKYETVSTKVRSDLKAQIEQKAKNQGLSTSKYISTVLEAYVNSEYTQNIFDSYINHQTQEKKKDYEKIALYVLIVILSFLLLR